MCACAQHFRFGTRNCFNGVFARRTGFYENGAGFKQIFLRRIFSGFALLTNDDLFVFEVGLRNEQRLFKLVGNGHAVPYHVNLLGVDCHNLAVPVDFHKFGFITEYFTYFFGKIGVKAYPFVRTFLFVVHGLIIGYSDLKRVFVVVTCTCGKRKTRHYSQHKRYRYRNQFFHKFSSPCFLFFITIIALVVVFLIYRFIIVKRDFQKRTRPKQDRVPIILHYDKVVKRF